MFRHALDIHSRTNAASKNSPKIIDCPLLIQHGRFYFITRKAHRYSGKTQHKHPTAITNASHLLIILHRFKVRSNIRHGSFPPGVPFISRSYHSVKNDASRQ